MIFPNMATTLGYIFTDAELSNEILSKLLIKGNNTKKYLKFCSPYPATHHCPHL